MKIVFLDRDGVINKYPGDTHYVTSWRQFIFIPGSIEAIGLLKRYGFKVFVVSNQAGVAKGIYSQKDLDLMTNRMMAVLHKSKVDLDGVYYCLHRDEDNCSCRKPKPGLIKQVLDSLNLKAAPRDNCFLVGDSFIDMLTARACGCKPMLVLSGKETMENRDNWLFEPEGVFNNLLEAAKKICFNYE